MVALQVMSDLISLESFTDCIELLSDRYLTLIGQQRELIERTPIATRHADVWLEILQEVLPDTIQLWVVVGKVAVKSQDEFLVGHCIHENIRSKVIGSVLGSTS